VSWERAEVHDATVENKGRSFQPGCHEVHMAAEADLGPVI
jgi:hypothetical protein